MFVLRPLTPVSFTPKIPKSRPGRRRLKKPKLRKTPAMSTGLTFAHQTLTAPLQASPLTCKRRCSLDASLYLRDNPPPPTPPPPPPPSPPPLGGRGVDVDRYIIDASNRLRRSVDSVSESGDSRLDFDAVRFDSARPHRKCRVFAPSSPASAPPTPTSTTSSTTPPPRSSSSSSTSEVASLRSNSFNLSPLAYHVTPGDRYATAFALDSLNTAAGIDFLHSTNRRYTQLNGQGYLLQPDELCPLLDNVDECGEENPGSACPRQTPSTILPPSPAPNCTPRESTSTRVSEFLVRDEVKLFEYASSTSATSTTNPTTTSTTNPTTTSTTTPTMLHISTEISAPEDYPLISRQISDNSVYEDACQSPLATPPCKPRSLVVAVSCAPVIDSVTLYRRREVRSTIARNANCKLSAKEIDAKEIDAKEIDAKEIDAVTQDEDETEEQRCKSDIERRTRKDMSADSGELVCRLRLAKINWPYFPSTLNWTPPPHYPTNTCMRVEFHCIPASILSHARFLVAPPTSRPAHLSPSLLAPPTCRLLYWPRPLLAFSIGPAHLSPSLLAPPTSRLLYWPRPLLASAL